MNVQVLLSNIMDFISKILNDGVKEIPLISLIVSKDVKKDKTCITV